MKTVFQSIPEVMHVYAQRTQERGRAGNVFFEGDTIYSYGYHYPLATFHNDGAYCIVNDEGYSPSTGQHISKVRRALSHHKVYLKSRVDVYLVHERVRALTDKLAKARKPELYIPLIYDALEGLKTFAEETGTTGIKSHELYREIKRTCKELDKGFTDWKAKAQERERRAIEAKNKRDAEKLAELLPKFRAGEISWISYGGEQYLRLSKDGTHVETSLGVRIKRENAATLYRLIERGVDIRGKHIEHYTVTSINGTLKIGCHNINMNDVHRIGKQITQQPEG